MKNDNLIKELKTYGLRNGVYIKIGDQLLPIWAIKETTRIGIDKVKEKIITIEP